MATITPTPVQPSLSAPQPPFAVERPSGHTRPSPDNEWLLTIGNGGFAMGTASGVNRRKYHALLIASVRPPVDRISCLASLDELLIFEDAGGNEAARFHLSAHRFRDGTLDPNGTDHLVRFEKTATIARWVYQVRGVEIVKELKTAWRRNACAVRYSVRSGERNVRLRITPRVTLRDFHSVNADRDCSRYAVAAHHDSMRITADGRTLAVRCQNAAAVAQPDMLRDVLYDFESERHQEGVEHQFTPGYFEVRLPSSAPGPEVFTVSAALEPDSPDFTIFDDDSRERHLAVIRGNLSKNSSALERLASLVDAADDFLVPRAVEGKPLTTVLAGYPWFSDWGRDTMISLPGLMLTTRRFDDARGALETFALHVKDGLIPNVFDDYGGPPRYNTVDASLWFLHACREYLRASGDRVTFDSILLPACHQIIDRYQSGTHFNIRMDPDDGLIESGDATTQLTWMDAKRGGVVFTPRHGKPVEVNALWHHGLLAIAETLHAADERSESGARAARYRALAARVGESFRTKFWNEAEQRLYDCLQRDASGHWKPTLEIRPNQIFAASLEFSPLTAEQKRGVLRCVTQHLLTPRGLRTLAPSDPNYQPRFEGNMTSRDRAYHNGTVWPWLLGPYCAALLRADNFSDSAKAQARAALQPLLDSMKQGCLGHIAEVYDAEPPRRPQGCVAQAWSVAEALRVGALIMA